MRSRQFGWGLVVVGAVSSAALACGGSSKSSRGRDDGGGEAGVDATSVGGNAGTEAVGGDTSGAGDASCPTGSEACPCYGNDTCDGDLVCLSGVCVSLGTGGSAGSVAGSGGSAGASADAGGTAGGTLGSAGQGGTAGGAGTSASGGGHGGTAGQPAQAGAGGSAGQPTTAGAGGVAGAGVAGAGATAGDAGAAGGAGVAGTSGGAGGVDLDLGLVAYYPFDGDANDASGNGNDGTVVGASLIVDRYGNPGSAYSFQTEGHVVETPILLDLSPAQVSITAWVHLDEIASSGNRSSAFVYGEYNVSSNTRNAFTLVHSTGSNTPGAVFDQFPPGGGNIVEYDTALMLDTWVHLAMVQNGDTVTMYLDGQVLGVTASEVHTGEPPTHAGIGARYGSEGWGHHQLIGSMDEVRIYDRALSPSEIGAHYELEAPTGPPS